MLELTTENVHIWFSFCDEIQDKEIIAHYRTLLAPNEALKLSQFRFSSDRHRYLVTRVLVRTVLSKYFPISPTQWSFSTNSYGKPVVANEIDALTKLSFNLSHTKKIVMLGVTTNNALGVDVENVRSAPLQIADRFFSPMEALSLRSSPVADQNEKFFRYWTLKEAYIKACGKGLSIPLNSFSFHLAKNSPIKLSLNHAVNDDPGRWKFWQLFLSKEHLAAICVERSVVNTQQVALWKTVPLITDEPLDMEMSGINVYGGSKFR